PYSLLHRSAPALLSFFSSRYCYHRDLHSFPTRRSSDLIDLFTQQTAEVAQPLHAPELPERDEAQNPNLPSLDAAPAGHAQALQRDRKSTRLNSSHQIISYAVFCLKKKTQQNLFTLHNQQ